MSVQISSRYSVATAAVIAVIFWLSSVPDVGVSESEPVVLFVWNVLHAPLFAGLAYCFLKMFSAGEELMLGTYGLAFAAAGGSAVADELHQSFVPGRSASIGDLLVDVAGILGMLLIFHVRARRGGQLRHCRGTGCQGEAR